MKKQTGFTLIELLVVIAIIALLMSILLPSLTRVRKQAKTTMCIMNLKTWGLMIQMYADDNNGSTHGVHVVISHGRTRIAIGMRISLKYVSARKLPRRKLTSRETPQMLKILIRRGGFLDPISITVLNKVTTAAMVKTTLSNTV